MPVPKTEDELYETVAQIDAAYPLEPREPLPPYMSLGQRYSTVDQSDDDEEVSDPE